MVLSCMTSVLWSVCSRFTSEYRDACPFSDLRCQKKQHESDKLSSFHLPKFRSLWEASVTSSYAVMFRWPAHGFHWKKNLWCFSKIHGISTEKRSTPCPKEKRFCGHLFFYYTIGESVLAVRQKTKEVLLIEIFTSLLGLFYIYIYIYIHNSP